jgi:hypothetical protein
MHLSNSFDRWWGGGSGFLGSLFGRASGGSVSKRTTIYGRRTEVQNYLYLTQSGQIQQSARGGNGGGATTVNFNINTVDASGFEELLSKIKRNYYTIN